MAKTRAEKSEIINRLDSELNQMKSAVIVDYRGLKVKDTEDLRRKLREQNVTFNVAKTSLLRRALKDHQIEVAEEILKQPIAIAFGMGDEVAPAKEIDTFAKTNEAIKVLGGLLEGRFIEPAKVKQLAALPSREMLYARVVGTIAAPMSGMVNVLAGNIRGLVNVLNGRKESIS